MWSNYLLIAMLTVCVVTDIRSRKIYNAVLFPTLCIAWILHSVLSGMDGLTFTVAGTAAGFGLLLIPYMLGGMGAGDVKLLAVIGAIKGTAFVLMAALYMALAGGIMAILILLFKKGFFKRMQNVLYFIHALLNGVKIPLFSDQDAMKTTYPYGVAIAAGTVYQIINQSGGLSL